MTNWKRIVILGLLAVLVGGVSLWVLSPSCPDPIYEGKRLSQWLNDAAESRSSRRGIVVVPRISVTQRNPILPATPPPVIYNGYADPTEAVRVAGTNAIPRLVKMLRASDSKLKLRVLALAGKQRIIPVHHIPAEYLNEVALAGLETLGKDAVPELIKIYQDDSLEQIRWRIARMLRQAGPEAKAAVPALLRGLASADRDVRSTAISALDAIRADMNVFLPPLTNALTDAAPEVRAKAAEALGHFGPAAKSAAPALAQRLNDSEESVRRAVIYALGAIGVEAGTAVPESAGRMAQEGEFESK